MSPRWEEQPGATPCPHVPTKGKWAQKRFLHFKGTFSRIQANVKMGNQLCNSSLLSSWFSHPLPTYSMVQGWTCVLTLTNTDKTTQKHVTATEHLSKLPSQSCYYTVSSVQPQSQPYPCTSPFPTFFSCYPIKWHQLKPRYFYFGNGMEVPWNLEKNHSTDPSLKTKTWILLT